MTQGNPLSPTIFNIVVDVVVRHWVMLAVEDAEKRRERGKEGRHQATLFYADDSMVASSDPRCLQWSFNALVGLLKRVRLCTNVGKMVSMTCRPCSEAGNQSEEAYGRKMMGKVPMYQERQNELFECGDCGKEMVAGLLASHRMTQYGKAKVDKWSWNK